MAVVVKTVVKTVLGSHFGVSEFTTHFRFPLLVVGLNRMFTGGALTHGHINPQLFEWWCE